MARLNCYPVNNYGNNYRQYCSVVSSMSRDARSSEEDSDDDIQLAMFNSYEGEKTIIARYFKHHHLIKATKIHE